MIFSSATVVDIKNKSGLSFDKAKDFELLAASIEKSTARHIGITTLKRLLGYINDERDTNEYTLNTIALYLGFENWEKYVKARCIDSVHGFKDESIYIHCLSEGTYIKVKYFDREILFKVIIVDEKNVLKVEKAHNSSLKIGDILIIYKLKKGDIIEAEKLIRGEKVGNYKTNGEITSIEITSN